MASKTSFLPRSAGVRNSGNSRIEKDSLGASEIPANVYWGIHTLRALHNFPLTGIRISSYAALVTVLTQIKRAAVLANFDLGLIDEAKKDAIVQACREIEQGELLDQFVVDIVQDGAGASTNTVPLLQNGGAYPGQLATARHLELLEAIARGDVSAARRAIAHWTDCSTVV